MVRITRASIARDRRGIVRSAVVDDRGTDHRRRSAYHPRIGVDRHGRKLGGAFQQVLGSALARHQGGSKGVAKVRDRDDAEAILADGLASARLPPGGHDRPVEAEAVGLAQAAVEA